MDVVVARAGRTVYNACFRAMQLYPRVLSIQRYGAVVLSMMFDRLDVKPARAVVRAYLKVGRSCLLVSASRICVLDVDVAVAVRQAGMRVLEDATDVADDAACRLWSEAGTGAGVGAGPGGSKGCLKEMKAAVERCKVGWF